MSLVELAASQPWAIPEADLRAILSIAAREHDPDAFRQARGEAEPKAIQAETGPLLEGTRAVTVRNGVGIVPIAGPIFRRANLFTELSGATSIDLLRQDLEVALRSRAVQAILLDVDSPGGQVNGTNELAEAIYQARGVKPMQAYVSARGTSAAYWIASATDRITADATAGLGSIGVVMGYVDTRKAQQARGVEEIEIVSRNAPNKRVDPATDEGRAKVQAMIDRLEAVFIDAVARNRGVTVQAVVERYGQGGVLIGDDAVNAGLADALGSFEGTLAGLAGGPRASRGSSIAKPGSKSAMSDDQTTATGEDAGTIPADANPNSGADTGGADQDSRAATTTPAPAPVADDAEAVARAFPNATAAIRTEGAAAERSRILGIEANALPGHGELVAKLKADGQSTPEQAAVAILKAEREKGSDTMKALEADGVEAAAPSAGPDKGHVTDPRTIAKEARKMVTAAEARGERLSYADACSKAAQGETAD